MNVGGKIECYGCGVCANACRRNAISIELNEEGFYHPSVDNTKCNDCGMCIRMCAHEQKTLSAENMPMGCYAAWSNNSERRKECSSGGIVEEILRQSDTSTMICAVRYNSEKRRAEHFAAKSEEEIRECRGSKYIQSYSVDGIREMTGHDGNSIFIGTPCQVDSMRRLMRQKGEEEKCMYIDFFCHGVPSYLLWEKYVTETEVKTGRHNTATWRDKDTGWHDSWAMTLKGEKGEWRKRRSEGDIFYRFYLNNVCLNKACHQDCKYKGGKSAADIRVGDLWGETYKDNRDGVSAVVTFTEKGEKMIHSINATLVRHNFDTVSEGQHKRPPTVEPKLRDDVMALLRDKRLSLRTVNRRYSIIKRKYKYIGIIKRLFR